MPDNITPSDTPSEISLISLLTTLDQKAIIRPNNPPPGIAGFLFDIVTDDSVELNSDITDHYIEDNTAIQDQIALKPERITVRGTVAELTTTPASSPAPAKPTNPLPLMPLYLPPFTPGAQQEIVDNALNAIAATTAATASKSIYNYYQNRAPNPPRQTRQSAAFQYFYSLWRSRQLFTVETPWGFWTTMAIESIRADQGEETKYASDFTVTFKKVRIAQDVTVNLGQLAGRNAPQAGASQPTQNGNSGKTEASPQQTQSWLYRWTHGP
jgi:hypothetical protein